MQKEDLQKIFSNFEEKIGKENYSKVADDIGIIFTDNETMNKTIENKDTEIKNLKNTNEMLVSANGNLLQQIGMDKEENLKPQPQKQEKISFKDVFDKNGNFIN